jgi:D-arginine dehydrogenase
LSRTSDILIVGGGIAGLSAAAALAKHASVTVIEAEENLGFHSSGRSAALLHYALGDRLIRALTLASRRFFDDPPEEFSKDALVARMPVLVHARESEREALDRLATEIAPFAALKRLDSDAIVQSCPVLRVGEHGSAHGLLDENGLKLDGNALLQGFARQLSMHGGAIATNDRVGSITRRAGIWKVGTEIGETFEAPLLVNAAGAWADRVADLARVEPVGLVPLKRTIIVFEAPVDVDVASLPFTKTITDELYFGREGGSIFASPMDEMPSEPCDAQPDEYEMALGAHRVEERTTMSVKRIAHRWAGLRSFTPDRHPALGFAADAEGFFWLAGQGGSGLQTSPVMARMAEALIAGTNWPAVGVRAAELSPARFLGQAA